MDLVSTILSALLFALFVPGAFFTFPKGGSKATVFVTHAVLFALTTHLVMRYYWHTLRGYIEMMGNYGETCPNGYVMTGEEGCVAIGHATYPPAVSMMSKSKTE
jgi:hypothetical protein